MEYEIVSNGNLIFKLPNTQNNMPWTGWFLRGHLFTVWFVTASYCLMVNTKKKRRNTNTNVTVVFVHLTVNRKANCCSSEPETSRQNTKMCGAGTLFVVTGMYILCGNLLSSCALKIKTPNPTVIIFFLFMLSKTCQTFGESRLRCRGTKHEHVLVFHSVCSLIFGTSISQASRKPRDCCCACDKGLGEGGYRPAH